MKIPIEHAQMVHCYLLDVADAVSIVPHYSNDIEAAEIAETYIKEVLIAASKKVAEDAMREVDEDTGAS